jgi:hypothetical protein
MVGLCLWVVAPCTYRWLFVHVAQHFVVPVLIPVHPAGLQPLEGHAQDVGVLRSDRSSGGLGPSHKPACARSQRANISSTASVTQGKPFMYVPVLQLLRFQCIRQELDLPFHPHGPARGLANGVPSMNRTAEEAAGDVSVLTLNIRLELGWNSYFN